MTGPLEARRSNTYCLRLTAMLIVLLLSALLPGRPAGAQDQLKIAAVVNDDVITELDVFMRLRMAMLSAHLQDTPETRQRLLPTVMRTLIDEHLKTQETKRKGINVPPSEVDRRIDDLAKRNNMSRTDFDGMLVGNGILVDTLADQISAELGWARLVQRDLRSTIKITDQEINDALARAKASSGQTEYRLSQIFLGVDAPNDEPAIRQSAERLLEQLQQGADFASLAGEFSQDQGAVKGGDFGWVRLDELDPEVAKVLPTLVEGQVGGPIRGTGGYYLVMVRKTRVADASTTEAGTVELEQIFWTMPANAAESEVNKAFSQAQALQGRIQSCADMAGQSSSVAPGVYRGLGNVLISDLPPEVQPYAINQPIGQPTPPVRSAKGVGMYIICNRSSGDEAALSRVAVADRLGRERLETLARGYLSDLRRAAYIDMRL